MEMNLYPLPNVPASLFKRLYRLNFRSGSPMRYALVKYKKRWDAFVIVIDQEGLVLGWSLVTPGRAYRQLRASFYVRQSERGKGLAHRLADEVDGLAKNMCCAWGGFHHDKASMHFLTRRRAFDVYDPPHVRMYYDHARGEYVWPSPWKRP